MRAPRQKAFRWPGGRTVTRLVLALAGLGTAASSASAAPAVQCHYAEAGEAGPAGNELRIKLRSEDVGARIRRTGSTIRVSSVRLVSGGLTISTGSAPLPSVPIPVAESDRAVACQGGVPEVATTDLIVARAVGSDQPTLDVDLRGGPFAPGATDEGDGGSEIEIEVRSGGGFPTPSVGISGTRRADRYRLGTKDGAPGVNLNPDETTPDVDLQTGAQLVGSFFIDGRGGPDVVTGSGGPEFDRPLRALLFAVLGKGADRFAGGSLFNFAIGGRGDDAIRSRRAPGFLLGGRGRDLLRSGGGSDLLIGGPGRDAVRAGAGSDLLRTADRTRDRIRCGRGKDALTADRKDRQRGCERVRRTRRR